MADKKIKLIIEAQDDASAVLKKTGNDLDQLDEKSTRLSNAFKTLGIAIVGAFSINAVKNFGLETLRAAGAMEQSSVAFETMLGSADKAKQLLGDIAEFAKKTPFNRTDLITGSKQLLAYNVAQEDVIKTMGVLGNISAGVGTDKLPQLILAFGQVKAATRLTGAELRQFSEAGVPLLQTLADQAGVSAAEIVDAISEGKVSLEQTEAALASMTAEGGKFFNLMGKQSLTLMGKLSNLQDGFDGLKISIGTRLLPAANVAVDGLNVLVYALDQGVQSIDRMVQSFNQMVAASPLLQVALIGIGTVLTALALQFVIIPAAVAAASTAWAVFTGIVWGSVTALVAFLAALSPIQLGLLLIGTGVILLANNLGILGPVLNEIYNGLGLMKQAILDTAFNMDILGFRAFALKMNQDALREATDALKAAQDRLSGANLSLEGANLQVERATKTYTEAVKKHGAQSLEAREAAHNLKLAEDNLKTAKEQVTKATDDTRVALQKEGEEEVRSNRGLQESTKIVQTLADKWRQLGDFISGAINRLREWHDKAAVGFGDVKKALGFQHGGVVPGSPSQPVPAILHGGERVVSKTGVDANAMSFSGGGSGPVSVNIIIEGDVNSIEMVDTIVARVKEALGRENELVRLGAGV